MLDLARLSFEQRQAVLAPCGPLAIVAGPGSGKTTVLAARIAYLVIARQVAPDSILAVSFTTKAARELRTRLVGVLGPLGREVDVTTFHAFGLRIIRHWVGELGLGPGPPLVYDEDDARVLLRDVAQRQNVDVRTLPMPTLASRLNRYRLGDGVSTPPWLRTLADEYEAALQSRGAVDFTAMLIGPLRLFDERPPALRMYQDAYRHILVDEFQDVSAPQYRLLQRLAARHSNLTVVGDPLQTLYAWRGADPDGLRHFQRDFPSARVFQLHHNYRSTGRILAVANALGASLDADRRLRTDNPAGAIPRLHATSDAEGEASFVAAEIGRLLGDGRGRQPSDIAVLYRTNHQADELGLALRERRLAYRVRGRSDLFHRREVRDALAFLRLVCNPTDTTALERIGKTQTPLPHTLFLDLHRQAHHLSPPLLLDTVLERTGFRRWLAEQPDGERRLGYLADLRRLLERVEGDLADWLDALRLGDDPEAHETAEQVTLTTIHASKGGEWQVVFVVGMEEGLLPHTHALMREPNSGAIQEEQRLAYVAVTRPRERLYLSYCRNRHHNGDPQPRRPSRFLNGLPLDTSKRFP
ncbi:MAG: ATP-dependent helicase [Anaerolineae bacterium]